MTIDDLLNMAAESAKDLPLDGWGVMFSREQLMRFAKLVAAYEREECAKVCDAKVDAEYATGKVDHNEMGWTQACAFAIRERGAP